MSEIRKRRIFLSHAGDDDDREAVVEFFAEMERQGFEYFDFAKSYEGLDIGRSLDEKMTSEIEAADLVVVFVSRCSTHPEKIVIQEEVRDSVQKHLDRKRLIAVQFRNKELLAPRYIQVHEHRLRDLAGMFPDHLLPLPSCSEGFSSIQWLDEVVHCCEGSLFFSSESWNHIISKLAPTPAKSLQGLVAAKSWLGYFSKLSGVLWPHIDEVEPGCFSVLGQEICRRLGLSFRQPLAHDERLPMYASLKNELSKVTPNYLRQVMMRQVETVRSSIVSAGWMTALLDIRAFDRLLERQGIDAYYTKVIEGTCLLGLKDYEKATAIFQRCLEYSQYDENAYGGLAQAQFHLNNFTRALQNAQAAVAFCTNKKDEIDHAPLARMAVLHMGIQVQASVVDGSRPDLAHLVDRALSEKDYLDTIPLDHLAIEDRIKYLVLSVHYAVAHQRIEDARALLEDILIQPRMELKIDPEALAAFPEVDNLFLAALASGGIYMTGHREGESEIRVLGNRNGFSVIDEDRTFRFERSFDDVFKLYYADLNLLQLAWQVADGKSHRAQALEGLKEYAKLIMLPAAIAVAADALNQDGNPQASLQLLEDALRKLPNDPELNLRAAFYANFLGDSYRANILAQNCANSCRSTLGVDQKAVNLLDMWGDAQNLLGNEIFTATIREIVGKSL